MSAEITQFYETEFAKNWEMKVQQKDSRLLPTVTTDSFRGKRKWYNQLDAGVMTEVTERKGDTPDGDTTGTKYWIYRRKFEFVRTWDEDDEMQLGSIALPDSDEIASFTAAEARTKDDVIIQAFDGTRKVGETGTETETFPSGQSVPATYPPGGPMVSMGLTVQKILRAKKILDENEVDDEDRYFVTSSQQLQDMLNITEITSGDYVNVKALVDGEVSMFAGFTFVRSERLPVDGNGLRSCFAYHKSGIRWADAGRSVHIDVLPNKRHARQLRGVCRMGAVRVEDKRVVRVLCDETPGVS
ncbi:hypothetical protein SAMN02745166_02254 [Prosthecobacter debontii]|uniref:Uncharacterized protein n=1 Tax=Prosthecobacter debontii TaxID=48467 RepID=A0A1T4XZP6_9BACT|nr:phage capsid protein [Prosthecobacter debontii]SKA95044.1 hypothetical protein SAMN02745166_02254 [Prosthecobacter debontii]